MVGRLVERSVYRALVAALIAITAACGDAPSIALTEWTLVDSAGSHEIRLPSHVDDLLASRGERYQLTSAVQLPERLRGQPLTLAIPRLPARVELRANGVPIEHAESALFVGYRSPGAHRWRLPGELTKGARLDLELTVVDTWFQSSWIGSIARLSTHPDGDRWYRFVSTFNIAANGLATALVGMIGFIYLLVYLGDRGQVAYGWFAAQALTAAAYPLFMLGPTQWLLGVHDLRLLPLVAIAAIVSVGYTHAHFQLPPASRWWLVAGIATILSAFFLRGPYSAAWGMWFTVGAIAVAAVYQVQLCIRLLLRGVEQGNAATQLVAWLVLGLTAGMDLMYWLGFGAWHRGLQGAAVGLTTFALLQTLALSREHLRAMREARALNEELRRQVSARSRQLSHALARLGRSIAKPVTPAEGTVIDDRYRVVRKLGEGAMATVYQVVRLEDGRQLALKQLKTSSDARILARFAREAHIASEVSHPNLVSIHDIDFASDGFMYIVMDLVSGGSVSDRRERYGDVPWALEVLRQTARGLAALHDSGVVHRDLKPANILLQEGDSVVAKISDFGVSGMLDDTGSDLRDLAHSLSDRPTPTAVTRPAIESGSETLETVSVDVSAPERRAALDSPLLTQAGHLLGTPAYMAPELHEGVDSSPVRDVFSFGVLAFELLTGERPYSTPPLLCRLRRQTTDEARRLTDACPGLPPELARHLQAAVSLVPDERPTLAVLVTAFDHPA